MLITKIIVTVSVWIIQSIPEVAAIDVLGHSIYNLHSKPYLFDQDDHFPGYHHHLSNHIDTHSNIGLNLNYESPIQTKLLLENSRITFPNQPSHSPNYHFGLIDVTNTLQQTAGNLDFGNFYNNYPHHQHHYGLNHLVKNQPQYIPNNSFPDSLKALNLPEHDYPLLETTTSGSEYDSSEFNTNLPKKGYAKVNIIEDNSLKIRFNGKGPEQQDYSSENSHIESSTTSSIDFLSASQAGHSHSEEDHDDLHDYYDQTSQHNLDNSIDLTSHITKNEPQGDFEPTDFRPSQPDRLHSQKAMRPYPVKSRLYSQDTDYIYRVPDVEESQIQKPKSKDPAHIKSKPEDDYYFQPGHDSSHENYDESKSLESQDENSIYSQDDNPGDDKGEYVNDIKYNHSTVKTRDEYRNSPNHNYRLNKDIQDNDEKNHYLFGSDPNHFPEKDSSDDDHTTDNGKLLHDPIISPLNGIGTSHPKPYNIQAYVYHHEYPEAISDSDETLGDSFHAPKFQPENDNGHADLNHHEPEIMYRAQNKPTVTGKKEPIRPKHVNYNQKPQSVPDKERLVVEYNREHHRIKDQEGKTASPLGRPLEYEENSHSNNFYIYKEESKFPNSQLKDSEKQQQSQNYEDLKTVNHPDNILPPGFKPTDVFHDDDDEEISSGPHYDVVFSKPPHEVATIKTPSNGEKRPGPGVLPRPPYYDRPGHPGPQNQLHHTPHRRRPYRKSPFEAFANFFRRPY